MTKVARFRLREGCKPPERVRVTLSDDILLERDYRYKGNYSEENFDIDYLIVLDDAFLQPYTPFYFALEKGNTENEFCERVIKAYNEAMRDFDWLEEVD